MATLVYNRDGGGSPVVARNGFVFEQLNELGLGCRTYLIGSPATKEAALVDPVLGSSTAYLARLEAGGWTLRYVIDTHTHADHLSGGRILSERTGAEFVMHKKAAAERVTLRWTDGYSITLGDVVLDFIETPGHTKDSGSIRIPGRILSGDWLFIGGAGRTDLPGGDPGEHWDSLRRVIPSLPEDTIICPGHDYQNHDESVLREEKLSNANLRPLARDEYVRWLAASARPTPDWMIETLRANREGATDENMNLVPAGSESACMCQPATVPPGVVEASVEEVRRRISSGGVDLLLDVREPDEYEGPLGHVPGAVLIPLGDLEARLSEIESYRDGEVVAICRSGSRSARACAILSAAGFRSVSNMTGGTMAWAEKGFPVER
jgi:glyoxylase-like metal-dependent hydrolase (beta-lactamase superfamily II)/rhodanese-related sulfurtransferase